MITSSNTSSAPADVAERAQRLEESRRRRDAAHVPGHRLDEDRRQVLAVALHGGGGEVDLVVVDDDRLGDHRRGHAGRGGNAERGQARAGVGEEGIGVAVVAARELDHPVAVRVGASEPKRGHRGLGARTRPGAPARPTGPRRRSPRRARPRPRSARRSSCPSSAASRTASTVSGSAWPKISGPHDCTQSSRRRPSAVSMYAPSPRANEERLVDADRAHRPHRRVDAAGDQLLRAVPELGLRQS